MAEQQGVVFPADDHGNRPSLLPNRDLWAASVRGVDAGLGGRIAASERWRKEYVELVRDVTIAGAGSATLDQEVARAGLEATLNTLVFERDGVTTPLSDCTELPARNPINTKTVEGQGKRQAEIVLPYEGEQLRGDALRRRLAAWVSQGLIEPSAANAINTVMENPDWLAAPGRRIAVMGAGAQTSPLPILARWGVELIAIDLPGRDTWERILKDAKRGSAKVHLPTMTRSPQRLEMDSGVNVIEDVPEIVEWLSQFNDQPLTLGFYIYADGALHVRATVAADVIGSGLESAGLDLSRAYTGTPSDCYLVSEDVVADSNNRRRMRPRRAFELTLRTASFGNLYAPAYETLLTGEDGEVMGVADAIVSEQGPNYSLAKRLQRWRTIETWRTGGTASFNVAPPTWTTSVTKNKFLAAGYYGARSGGLEVFEPDTMKVLMAALLIYDLHVPPTPAHPELMISQDAVHGGYWRTPHEIRSTLIYTAVAGLPKAYLPGINFR